MYFLQSSGDWPIGFQIDTNYSASIIHKKAYQ